MTKLLHFEKSGRMKLKWLIPFIFSFAFLFSANAQTETFCNTQIQAFGGDAGSDIFVSIFNVDDQTMRVEIESADDDPVDLLVLPAGAWNPNNAGISIPPAEVEGSPGVFAGEFFFPEGAPETVELFIEWSKVSFAGNWRSTTPGELDAVDFNATCNGGGFDDGLLTNGDFEDGTTGWTGNALNVQTDGGNSFNLADVATAGNAFDVNLSQVLALTQDENYVLSFEASTSAGNTRTILAGIGLNEQPFTSDTEEIELTEQTQLYTLELIATGIGGDNSRVLFDMGAEAGVVVIDNVSLKVNDEIGEDQVDPTTAATTPTENANDVISIYSDAFTDVPNQGFNLFGGAAFEIVDLGGNEVLKYTTASNAFQVIELGADNQIDAGAAGMTNFRFDAWFSNTVDGTSSFLLKVVDFGATTTEAQIVINPSSNPAMVQGQWLSYDFTLDELAALGLGGTNNIQQVVVDVANTGEIYLDNIYFYNADAGGGEVDFDATASKDLFADARVLASGDDGSADHYASGNDDDFASYAVASFAFTKNDFDLTPNSIITDISPAATYTLTHNDRSFTDGDEVEVFITFDQFDNDFSPLTFDNTLVNGLNSSQFSSEPVSLGAFPYTPEAGGSTDEFTLDFSSVKSELINALNNGEEFNIIIAATDAADDVTYSGLNNSFDPGNPNLTLEVAVENRGSAAKDLFADARVLADGDDGSADHYASGNDDNFGSFAIASFDIAKSDFGAEETNTALSFLSATYTLTHNDRSFTDGDEVEIFITFQQFNGDYSGLTYDNSLINGLDVSQFSSAPISLGSFPYTPEAGGSTDEFSLDLSAVEAQLLDAINSGQEFSLIIAATDAADDVTYSGLDNTFDPGNPNLELDLVWSEPVGDVIPEPTEDAFDVIFDDNFASNPLNNGWTQFSAAGDFTWSHDVDNSWVALNPFSQPGDGCNANDYLISPEFSLTNLEGVVLTINSTIQFGSSNLDNVLEVFYSQNYDPEIDANPESSTLIKLGEIEPLPGGSSRIPVDPFVSGGLNGLTGDARIFIRNFNNPENSCASWAVNDVSITANSISSTAVVFSDFTVNTREGAAPTIDLELNIVNESADNATTADVVLASGEASDVGDFTTQSVTFDAGSSATQTVTIAINDDDLDEGTENLVFELQNVSGGDGAIAGPPTSITLILADNDQPSRTIAEIQGEAQMSPLVDSEVSVTGIVTAIDDDDFYIQSATPDSNPNTSEALFISASGDVPVSIGDEVTIVGLIEEGEGDPNENTRTQIAGNPLVVVNSSGNTLPDPTLVGRGGRIAPGAFIDSDPSTFDPTKDGADFWESMENMLVKVQDPMAVSPVGFFDVYVVADNGADATGLSPRNTLVLSKDDFNPEKIEIALGFNDLLGSRPSGAVEGTVPGSKFSDVTGIITYDRGQYELTPTEDFTLVDEPGLEPVVTDLNGNEDKLSIATYNVLNLDPNDDAEDDDIGDGRFVTIANQIINNLNSPDIIGLQEIQDNTGSEGPDGVTSADETLELLVTEITNAGGPDYEWIDNTFLLGEATSGGDPNGNIRTAFLYNPARVSNVTIPNDTVAVRTISSQNEGDAFEGARLPLVAAFSFRDTVVTIVNNHFSSKGGSAPIYGQEQPFIGRQEDLSVNGSLDERQRQSRAVQDYVETYMSDTDGAPIVVMGDLNEFDFVSPVLELEENADLFNLTKRLPENERYTFIFQGNAQSLDHILVSSNLIINAETQIVHINPEFGDDDEIGSDHEPVVALLDLSDLTPLPEALGQTTIVSQISASEDDAEEYFGASENDDFRPDGSMDVGSSDLELGFEANDPLRNRQITGLRFNALDIPKGARIISASVQFTVDNTSKNLDPANYFIKVEDSAMPAAFAETDFDITSRNFLNDSVEWNIPAGSWTAAGDAGSAERTSDIGSLVQRIVDKAEWVEGGSIALYFEGEGIREAESFDGDPAGAPQLIVTYLPAVMEEYQVSASEDDAEEYFGAPENDDFRPNGSMDVGSSDIELGFEDNNPLRNRQISGLRFTGVEIPPRSEIKSAFIQFTVDNTSKNLDPANYFIKIEDNVEPAAFSETDFDITSRSFLNDSVEWNVPAGSWTEIGAAGSDERSADVSSLIQQIINKPDWTGEGALALFVEGEGIREAESFDGDPAGAARLFIDFVPSVDASVQIAASEDDAEEYFGAPENDDFRPDGSMDVGSSDIELGFEDNNPLRNRQVSGLIFRGLDIPKEAVITSASIQFTVDNTSKNLDPANYFIKVEDSVDPESFEEIDFNITNRTFLNDSVEWNVEADTWIEIGAAGPAERSADIGSLLQQIVNKPEWVEGSSVAFYIEGEGIREAESFDGDPAVAAVLNFSFLSSGTGGSAAPEVVAQVPDVKTTVGGSFKVDLNIFFRDTDTPLKFFATDVIGNQLPESITIDEEGILSGTLNKAAFIPVEVFAESFGDTVSTTFNISAEPLTRGVLKEISSIQLGTFDEGAAEISAFDESTNLLFVTNAEINAVEVLDLSDPNNPVRTDTIDVSGDVNSVAVSAGILAIAIANDNAQLDGTIDVYTTSDFVGGTPSATTYTVGALPDMVTFADDSTLVVANEGEPSDDYTVDPEGSVSIIDLTNADLVAAVTTADFTAFNGQEESLRAEGVRIFGPGATVAQDLEPEYITVQSGKAYVALQENNALAVVDIATATVEDIIGLGFKDHSLPGNGLDANNDEDSPILIDSRLPLKGMYQPDAIASIVVGNTTYILSANEGDGREYEFEDENGDDVLAFTDETEIGDIELDPNSFADVALIEELADGLGVSTVAEKTADGKFKELFTYGSRSFSIWDASTGEIVFDSEDDFEQITAALFPENFNATNDDNEFKDRSDNKGPEPEAITIGTVGTSTLAFIGLERIGGIMVYDITDPTQPSFVEYINNRDFSIDADAPGHGDLGPEGLVFVPASESPNGGALLIVSNEVSSTVTTYQVSEPQPTPDIFTLELLHVADQEAAGPAIQDAPRFSAVMNALEAQDVGDDNLPDNTIRLSSGDAFLPGLFRDASVDLFGTGGVADMQIQNELGFLANSFGNHEFDFGTGEIAKLISGLDMGEPIAVFDDPAFEGTDLEGKTYTGTSYPYLSSNLDFSTDENMAPLEIDPGLSPVGGKISSTTVININGESIGVVGATTPFLKSIASPGDMGVFPEQFAANPSAEEIAALAAIIQEDVDALLEANPSINKVILLAHMQQIEIEFELAQLLENVDIIVAGGSNTRLFDENDRPRAGDSDQGMYPMFFAGANGDSVAVVNTDAQYKYVGRLVVDFDADGKIIPSSYDPEVSGAYATDSLGVAELDAFDLIDPEIQALASAVESTIVSKESVVLGRANVFLNGNRSGQGTGDDPDGVRTQETNLGNLTADANLVAAKAIEPEVVVSIKNGGGIRASIGRTIVLGGGSGEAERLPNEELVDSDGNVVKPDGGISQNDIATTLAFNNGLSLLTLTKEELKAIMEHGVAQSPLVDGRFPQIAGVSFSFDDTQPEGSRIQNAVIVDENGETIEQFVSGGDIVESASSTYRIVTLNFLAGGGDGYPFPEGPEANRVDLFDLDGDGNDDGATGDATFANDGSEQDALAEYLLDNFNTEESAFAVEDVGPALDERIQNLAFREDGIGALNNAPTIANAIPDQIVNAGESTGVDLANVFSDADGDALSFTASSSNTAIATVVIDGSTATINGLAEGTATVTVTADDGNGGTVTDEFEVTVEAGNVAPVVANAIEDQEFDEGFGSATIDLTDVFSDADGDALTLIAESSDDGVVTVEIADNTLTITEAAPGTATVTVTADDGVSGTVSDDFEVVVNDLVTGIEDELNITGMYPNPVEDNLTIIIGNELSISDVKVYNLNGKLVKSIVPANKYGTITISLEELQQGVYFVSVNDSRSGKVLTKRVIKQ